MNKNLKKNPEQKKIMEFLYWRRHKKLKFFFFADVHYKYCSDSPTMQSIFFPAYLCWILSNIWNISSKTRIKNWDGVYLYSNYLCPVAIFIILSTVFEWARARSLVLLKLLPKLHLFVEIFRAIFPSLFSSLSSWKLISGPKFIEKFVWQQQRISWG